MQTLQAITLGCSKNTVDTGHLLARLDGLYDILPEGSADYADVLLINTCAFIADAKQQSIDTVLEAARRKAEGLAGKLYVFGCLSQRYAEELPGLIPEVDGWFGAREIDSLVEALGGKAGEPYTERLLGEGEGHYAYLKISEGCDRRCSYCAIPHIRGAHRSVPIESLVSEARHLAGKGVKELILIAQDTTYYGLDIYGKRTLARLMRELAKVEGIEWIRLHYSYPAAFPEDVLEVMAEEPKICKYLDIPLQHISDKVLSNMRRGHGTAQTRALVEQIRRAVPGVVLRTTMITGHPGEGEEEFAELLDFVREAGFERLGAFAYSEEEGTFGAEHFKDEVPEGEKSRRLDALMEVQREVSRSFNLSRVGSLERVIVDSHAPGILVCRSQYESPEVDGEIIVELPEGAQVPTDGSFIDVKITAAGDYDLRAVPAAS